MKSPVSIARLRLTQRLLINAADVDPALHQDPQWMKAMVSVQGLLLRAKEEPNKGWEVTKETIEILQSNTQLEREIRKVA